MKVMLDTSVLVNMFLAQNLKKEGGKLVPKLVDAEYIREELSRKKFVNIITLFLSLEYREVMQHLLVSKKYLEHGYLPPNFRDARDELPLTKEELETISIAVSSFIEESSEIVLVDTNNKAFLELLQSLCSITGVGLLDTIHFLSALATDCDYFVTDDAEFIKAYQNTSVDYVFNGKTKCIRSSQFKQILSNP